MLGGDAWRGAAGRARRRGRYASIVLENDLYRRAARGAGRRAARSARAASSSIDHQLTRDRRNARTSCCRPPPSPRATARWSTTKAGRSASSRSSTPAARPRTQAGEGWRWLAGCERGAPRAAGADLDEVTAAWRAALPALAGIVACRAAGATSASTGEKIARQPHRYSGPHGDARQHLACTSRTPPEDPDSPLAFSMEGYAGPTPPAPLIPLRWAPGWNSPQALNKFQDEVGGPLRGGDPGVRLIEPAASARRLLRRRPASLRRRAGDAGWSRRCTTSSAAEELSRARAGDRASVPAPYVALHPERRRAPAASADGAAVRVHVGAAQLEAAACDRATSLPRGRRSACPAGLPGRPAVSCRRTASVATGGQRMSSLDRSCCDRMGRREGGHHRCWSWCSFAAGLIWLERRLLALWQDRYGPNRVGPFGLLQVVADMIKIFSRKTGSRPSPTSRSSSSRRRSSMSRAADRPSPWSRSRPDLVRGRSQHRPAVLPGDVVARRSTASLLAGWSSQQQVRAARRPARRGADAQLRGVHGPVADGRGDAGRLVQPARHRRGAAATCGSCVPQFLGFVVFLDRRPRRDAPHARSTCRRRRASWSPASTPNTRA